MNKQFFKSFVGDKNFYRRVCTLMIPIMIQNGITNFVNMLDNVMIGRIGNVEMTGVAIANQLIFIFNLAIWGAISGPSIYGAQFFGKGDHKGHMHTFRFKFLLCTILSLLGISVFYFFGTQLSSLYLTGDGNPADIAASLAYARQYLLIMFVGLVPYAVAQCYASTLRETGQATIPMLSGLSAVLVNLCLNYILIFGKFGAPALGVGGAAIATVISRFVELLIVGIWTHTHTEKAPFIIGAYKSIYIPKSLIVQISVKGLPLLINETMFALGTAMTNQCYSTMGYDVVSANNICQTFYNVFGVAFMAVGSSIAIILGQLLGADKLQEAKDSSRKLIAFSVFISILVGAVFSICATFIPHFYNVSDTVRQISKYLMIICAVTMPMDALFHSSYFTLRAGGKIFITMIFDSGFILLVVLPLAFILSHYTTLSILYVYGICQAVNIIKCTLGAILVNKGVWLKNIVENT